MLFSNPNIFRNRILLIVYLLPVGISIFSGCSKEDIQPRITIPGHETKCLFFETFDAKLDAWKMEGNGKMEKSLDNRLNITLFAESPGVMIWLDDNFSTDILLEYDIDISKLDEPINPSSSLGYCWTFIYTEDQDGNDILKNMNRTGDFENYTNAQIKSYQISYHCFNAEGEHRSGSHVRKNPYNNLLSASDIDPCMDNRKYTIHIAKMGDRIQFYVDGILVHDVRDGANYKNIYKSGKIGFWFQGSENETTLFLDNVRVFKLFPSL